MVIQCQILLMPPIEGKYKSGSPVIGTLIFNLKRQTTFDSVILHLKGKGKCSWQENHGKTSTNYSGKEDYVRWSKNVMLGPQTYLEAGDHNYPFEFYLPPDLPSSFKDSTCTIAYTVVADFKTPGLFGSKKFHAEITVYGDVEPVSPQPLIFGLNKKLFSFNSLDILNLKIEIEKTFLVAGEDIKLNCTINNQTNVSPSVIKTKLVTVITYISDSSHKMTKRKTIKESIVKHRGIEPNSLVHISYTVPTLPRLYSIQHSKILVREYKIKVTVKMPLPHKNASVEIPVVIGEPMQMEHIEEEKAFAQEDFSEERPLGFVL